MAETRGEFDTEVYVELSESWDARGTPRLVLGPFADARVTCGQMDKAGAVSGGYVYVFEANETPPLKPIIWRSSAGAWCTNFNMMQETGTTTQTLLAFKSVRVIYSARVTKGYLT